MEMVRGQTLESWIVQHAEAAGQRLYFTINGDVSLTNSSGKSIIYEIPVRGKRVCVLHPEHLTEVAMICYQRGIQMIQVIL